ncbi:hypothetical protein EOI86_11555 [Hwanghaeella grinnelliae]|uniref:Glutamine amidotransferase domain-containing protein n=1 Tax=Hwanghaeella grinnelliae TaxID=2500179 RepID=A0A3S2VNX2_9PROT|nr:hypothetical protein [Hwanghaeella grinnelliae]RVU35887.1 hypothetical protein EOI86_11555 [Hwanghaeella grinnelliae]
MSDLAISFAPLIPWWSIAVLAGISVLIAAYGLFMGANGSLIRLGAAAVLALALANPSAVSEDREPLKDVAVIIVDETPSQDLADRKTQTDAAVEDLTKELDRYSATLETRVVRLSHSTVEEASTGSRLLRPLRDALADVPPRRVAGAIVVSDGQIHDLDQITAGAGRDQGAALFPAPVHGLITGKPGEADRRLSVLESPSFGLVGESADLVVRVDDPASEGQSVRVTVKVDDAFIRPVRAQVGENTTIRVPLDHRGETVIELAVPEGPQELTLQNNEAVVTVNGVRDRLRVLLVSGEPHPGERTWRNLLKSDPSVDLVHFTILRPPEKQDGTPIHELSLIAFPTRELFEVKLHEFDLVVFDRFRRRGVLPSLYLSNIVDYVQKGGAFLEASGPSFAGPYSLFRTPLGRLLPGEPTGAITMRGFKPNVTDVGMRHPVTSLLPGGPESSANGEPQWGRWFRQIEIANPAGDTLMRGLDNQPLLVLDRAGEGRVAQFLSDQIWLWARGFESGGPQRELLRRLAHWLMKEPDLEENDLRAELQGGQLVISRRSLEDRAFIASVTDPDGVEKSVPLEVGEDGVHRGSMPVTRAGVYRISDGTLFAITAVGDLNPIEYSDVAATTDKLAALSDVTGGQTGWLESGMPRIRRVDPDRPANGPGWIGLRKNGDFVVTGISATTLLPAALVLALLLGLMALGWWREAK